MKNGIEFLRGVLPFLIGVIASSTASAMDYFVEAKASYFYPTGGAFREVYSGGALYGLEFDCQAWKQLYVWADIGYFTKAGHTVSDQDYTRLTMVPISSGLKYIYNKHRAQPYVGIGAETTYLQIHTNSQYLIRSNSNWGIGGIFKAGVLINLCHGLMLDFHTDYSQMKVHMGSDKKAVVIQSADLSGFAFGGSLGYRF